MELAVRVFAAIVLAAFMHSFLLHRVYGGSGAPSWLATVCLLAAVLAVWWWPRKRKG